MSWPTIRELRIYMKMVCTQDTVNLLAFVGGSYTEGEVVKVPRDEHDLADQWPELKLVDVVYTWPDLFHSLKLICKATAHRIANRAKRSLLHLVQNV